MIEVDRAAFLRLGAAGTSGLVASALAPAVAGAGLPAPSPQDDDVGFLSFATVGERASRDVYRAARAARGAGFGAGERAYLARVAAAKRAHVIRLDAALGADAPLTEDFATVLPRGATRTRSRALALAAQLEQLLVGVYLNGVAYAADPATRLLLGRLLVFDGQVLGWLRRHRGGASPAGLPSPIDLEAASARLDRYLTTPDFPD